MKGVLFDVDDTLVDHGGAQDRAFRDMLDDAELDDEAADARGTGGDVPEGVTRVGSLAQLEEVLT